MAINLSAQRAMTRNSVAKANKFAETRNAIQMALYVLLVSMFSCDSIIRLATDKGCATKPTPRSETARLRSNVFKFFDKEGVFLIAVSYTHLTLPTIYSV